MANHSDVLAKLECLINLSFILSEAMKYLQN